MIIGPDLKDKILKNLVEKTPLMRYSGSFESEAKLFELEKEVYHAILTQFDKKGFVKLQSFAGGAFFLNVKVEAHDYLLAGGHVGEFDALETEMNKLKAELYALEKTISHQAFEKVKGSVDTIVSIWSGLLTIKQ